MAIVFDGRYATNGFTGLNKQEGVAGRIELVSDPAGSGVTVGQFRLDSTDPPTAGWPRSEVAGQATQAIGSEFWYWWTVYLPEDWPPASFTEMIVFQIHETADVGDAGHYPPLAFDLQGTDLLMYSAADANATTVTLPSPRLLARMPVQKGRWHEFVVNVTWDYSSSGALKVWQDRRAVFNETGIGNCFNDAVGVYIKEGTYAHYGFPAGVDSVTTYHKGVIVADNTSTTFDQFMAECGFTDMELEGFVTRGVSL